MYVNGKHVQETTLRGRPIDSLTYPRENRCSFDELISALQWGANDLSQRGLGFRAGQVVTTGSPHVPVEATAGSEIVIRYGDTGEIKAKFVSLKDFRQYTIDIAAGCSSQRLQKFFYE